VGALCNHSLELTGVAGDPESPIHRLDPRAKILGLLGVTVVAVSTPVDLWPIYLACLVALGSVAAVARVPAGQLWRRARFVLALVLLAALFLPFVRSGGEAWSLGPLTVHEAGLERAGAVGAKAMIGVAAAVLLGATTSFASVLSGLRAMRAPRLLVLIAGFMYRYLYVIVEEMGRMRASLAARAYRPRHALHAGPVGRMATAMFIRTYQRGERVHRAMLARGYDGEIRELEPLALRAVDLAFAALLVGSLLSARVIAGIAA
jgi:cobalt/nickel transport system permease protein